MTQTIQSEKRDDLDFFRQCYHRDPAWHIIAPGRVNLIGEHTDYNQLPVLPMPLDRHVTVYAAPNADGVVRIRNVDSAFPDVEIDLSREILPSESRWGNYGRAAVKMVLSHLASPESAVGFDAVVSSDLPLAAGLSSSSALVIAVCTAMLKCNDLPWTPAEVAERMRLAEQFVGTAGGGMDQAIIAMGEPNSALIIGFDPLTTESVRLPEDLHIYVINSGQKAEKTGNARFFYNRRSLECALGVELLRRGAPTGLAANCWTSLRDAYQACKQDSGCLWQELLLGAISPEPYTRKKLVGLLGEPLFGEICQGRQLDPDATAEWLPDGQFQIFPRVAHVMGEADRVYAFGKALKARDFEAIYHIAKASHASCRDLYHISTQCLEALIGKAVAAGAGAARITGAGFGGCIVAFVPEENKTTFVPQLIEAGVTESSILESKSQGGVRVNRCDS